ncbi:uncharacterized protein LOC129840250 [Salvelinus fontinalis]|uniref:uncharacterized protein LOC129840250 n=1 Tax=Salvelinus fontinalis TaxID=8038 RepID=UPI002485BD70|nr:uncharacterized protein LOC129840250 [Salvelinus fontinalis]
MPKLTLIELCFWLYVAQNVVSGVYPYHEVGGELVLTPDKSTVPDSITSILWKHGKYKVAEWDKDFGGLDIYGAFKERTTLDQNTGELRISGLMTTDSGVYSVEFNSKLLDKTYKLSVIKAVPKPTITSSCNPDKTSCTLTCEGDTTDAEPVTYSWKVGEGAWEVLDKQLIFSKSNTGKSNSGYNYICKLKNAVSGEVSEPVGEVFGSEYPYHEVGGELVLTPDKSTVPDSITSILWKHGKYKVAEWDKDFGGLDIYAAFKERTTLDQNTGELRISGLMKTDSGVYSVEFNSKLLDKTYTLSVIKAVPKPTITSSCNANLTSCILTCEGDTTDAEPVTYSWKMGEGAWEVFYKQRNVSKNDTGKSTNSYKFFCKMKNSAGEGEVSEPVELVLDSDGWLTKSKLFGISVFVLAIAGVLLFILGHRAKTGVWFFEKESMPWKGEFWKHQREVGPTTDTSNGVSAPTEEALARKNDHKDDSVNNSVL